MTGRGDLMGLLRRSLYSLLAMTIFGVCLLPGNNVHATPPVDKYVRTAAPFMKNVDASEYDALAQFDLVILPAELQLQGSTLFDELRRRNTDIVLLAYVPTKSYIIGWGDALHLGLKSGINDAWFLRDTSGGIISVWPGTQALSATTAWNTYLPQYVHDRILSTGLWDGIFYDEVSGDISWVNGGNVDLNRDGIRDFAVDADTQWKNGMVNLLRTAQSLDQEKIFVINGSSTPEFQQYINGRMFETFPTPWEANGDWYEIMRRYHATQSQVDKPETFIVNANTGNTGNRSDYRKMRFALGSTLLGNGYFSFDYGDQDHSQTWRYDEYDAYLGRPTSAPKNFDNPTDPTFRAGVWQRDFQNGVVLVNPTGAARTLTFGSEYEKIRGTQDTITNDGSIVSSVNIPANDSIIMRRPLEKLVNAPYVNGAFARIFNAKGEATRTGFFSYDGRFRGSTIVFDTDIDRDGQSETIVADRDRLRIYRQDQSERLSITPFGAAWRNGMEVATGDVDGDGINDLVVAAGPGGSPQVKKYNLDGKEKRNFLAFNTRFKGGIHLAVGNVDADARAEIIVGAGPGGGPHVRVYNDKGIVKNQFFPYDQRFKGGVYVAAGDVTGAGYGQVITGAGFGGGPHVRVVDVTKQNMVLHEFFAFDKKLRGGVRVSAADSDGNGIAEVYGMSTDVFTVTFSESSTQPAPADAPASVPPEAPSAVEGSEVEGNPTIPERPLFLGIK